MSARPVIKAEIQLRDSTWLDITATEDVYTRNPIETTRGRANEDGTAAPQHCTLTVDDRDGRYSPRNATSDLFGQIGRNTPLRLTVDGAFRWHGEIAAWSPQRDLSIRDGWVPLEADGLLRRLGQGNVPVSTGLREYILARSPATYYTLLGGEGTTYSLNQGVVARNQDQFRGVPAPGPGPVFTYGRELPFWLGTGMELNATGDTSYMSAQSSATQQNIAFDWVYQSPALGVLTIDMIERGGHRWNLVLNTASDDATLQVILLDRDGAIVASGAVTAPIEALQDTALHHVRFQAETSGADSIHTVYIDGVSIISETLGVGHTVNGCREIRIHYTRFSPQTIMTMAHLTLWQAALVTGIPAVTDTVAAALGYVGESAGARITRVLSELGIPVQVIGTSSAAMGAQPAETPLAVIREAEATDMGILAERRDALGLLYLTRTSLYGKTPGVVLDYGNGQISAPFTPTDDDQQTRNDVTATRRDGGEGRVTRTTGPLGTQNPPAGVGQYADDYPCNPVTDAALRGIAAWRVNLGTLDQPRFPQVTVNLASPDIDDVLAASIRAVEIGELLQIVNLTRAGLPSEVDLLVLGYGETVGPVEHVITFNCAPYTLYDVRTYSDTRARWSPLDSVTTTAVGEADISIVVDPGRTRWTTQAASFPFDIAIGGERIRVTNITGTDPQTITAERAINGVVKSHPIGAAVTLWDPARWAL